VADSVTVVVCYIGQSCVLTRAHLIVALRRFEHHSVHLLTDNGHSKQQVSQHCCILAPAIHSVCTLLHHIVDTVLFLLEIAIQKYQVSLLTSHKFYQRTPYEYCFERNTLHSGSTMLAATLVQLFTVYSI
jgi:hypothetical protein